MSVAVVPLTTAPARARGISLPRPLLIALAGAGCALAARGVSIDAFLWTSGLGLAAATVWPLARTVRRGWDAGDVLPMFVLYYSFSILLRGGALLTFLDSPYLHELGDSSSAGFRDLLAWTFFHSAIGLVAAVLGHDSGIGTRWAAALVRGLPAIGARWRQGRLLAVAGALGAIGLLGAIVHVHGPSGFVAAATNPMTANGEESLGFWWLIAVTEFAVVGFHVHMIGLLLRNDRRFPLHFLVLGLGLGIPLYLVSSSKFLLLRLLFLPWLFRHFLVRRVPVWQILVAFTIFGALFPIFYAYRALGMLGLDGVQSYLQTTDMPLLKMFTRSYGADSFMLILMRTGHTLPFQWGGSLLDLLSFWVPRLLWPAKPMSFGLQFPLLYMPDVHWGAMTYVTSSLPGELFLDFHLPGVIAGSALLGAAMRASRALADRGPGGLLLYGYAFLTAMHLVEGCIASQVETLLTHLVPALLAIVLLNAGMRGRQPAGGHA